MTASLKPVPVTEQIEKPTMTLKQAQEFTEHHTWKLQSNESGYYALEDSAIFLKADGNWVGSFRSNRHAEQQLTVAFESYPGGQSRIECRCYVNPNLTTIPLLNRPEIYVQKALFTPKSIYNELSGGFRLDVRSVPAKGHPLPQQILDIPGYEEKLERGDFQYVTLIYKPSEVLGEHLNNDIAITEPTTAARCHDFKELLCLGDEEATVKAIVRWSHIEYWGIINHVRAEFRKEIAEGDMYRRCFGGEDRLAVRFPEISDGNLLSMDEGPDFKNVKLQLTYPGFPEMATLFAYGLKQSHDYEKICQEALQNSYGHSVKVLRLPDTRGRSNKWLGIFRIDNKTEGIRLMDGTQFSFRFTADPRQIFDATVAPRSLGLGFSGETVAWVKRRHNDKFGAAVDPFNEKGFTGTSHFAIRGAINHAESYEVEDIKIDINASDIPYARQMDAVKLYAKESKDKLVMHNILCGKQVSSANKVNIIEGAEIYLEHLKDQDMINCVNYLKSVPDGLGIIWGPAGTGKTHRLAEIARAKVCKAIVDDINNRKADPACHPNPAGILMSAPSNAASDVIVKTLRKVLFIKNDNGMRETLKTNAIIVRGHSAGTEDSFIKLSANFTKKYKLGVLDQEDQEKVSELGLLTAKDQDDEESLLVIEQSESIFNPIEVHPVNPDQNDAIQKGLGNWNAFSEAEKGVQVAGGNSKASPCSATSSDHPSSVDVAAHTKLQATPSSLTTDPAGILLPNCNDADLEDNFVAEEVPTKRTGTAGLNLIQQLTVEAEKFFYKRDNGMLDDRFVLVNNSLGYLMLETAGLLKTRNKHTSARKWSSFRRLHDKASNQTELSKEDQKLYEKEKLALRTFCIGIIDILVTTHINVGSEPYQETFQAKDVYLDEASLATWLENIVIFQAYPKANYILAGDPKQLSPMVNGPKDLPGCMGLLKYSLLEVQLLRYYPFTLLTTQHRSATGLMDIANTLFYRDQLKDGAGASDESRNVIKTKLVEWMNKNFPVSDSAAHIDQNDKSYIHLDVEAIDHKSDSSTSTYNMENAAVVLNVIENLLRDIAEVKMADITIVVPYVAQLELYSEARKKAIASFPPHDRPAWIRNRDKWESLTIATADSYQGGSNKIIILDMVKTECAGFLNDHGRMCVGLTRAEQGLFVVGKSATIRARDEVWVEDRRNRNRGTIQLSCPTKVYNAFAKRGRSRDYIPSEFLESNLVVR